MINMIKILYENDDYVVCVKPSGALSTDEEGGMPELIKDSLGIKDSQIYTVHRLDRIVSGVMVYAKSKESAARFGRMITDRILKKEYLGIIHGCPESESGRYDDLLFRDKEKNMSYVVKRMRKGVRDAALEYEVLAEKEGFSLVKIRLLTGRTHQIRAQFSSRGMPLAGDKKYGAGEDSCRIALWSYSLEFDGIKYSLLPPSSFPWTLFEGYHGGCEEQFAELPERKKFRESADIKI